MRCKGCDNIMSEIEMLTKDSVGNYEEMCSRCLRMSGIYADVDAMDSVDDEWVIDYPYDEEQALIEEILRDNNRWREDES